MNIYDVILNISSIMCFEHVHF